MTMKMVSRSVRRGRIEELWSNGDDVLRVTHAVTFARRPRWYDRCWNFIASCWRWSRLQSEGRRHVL